MMRTTPARWHWVDWRRLQARISATGELMESRLGSERDRNATVHSPRVQAEKASSATRLGNQEDNHGLSLYVRRRDRRPCGRGDARPVERPIVRIHAFLALCRAPSGQRRHPRRILASLGLASLGLASLASLAPLVLTQTGSGSKPAHSRAPVFQRLARRPPHLCALA
jgi:hypothetical protein